MKNVILNLLFPNRCLQCNTIISADQIVCEECYSLINFTHWDHLDINPLEERLHTLFEVRDVYALMNYEKDHLSQKIIHQLKYAKREVVGKILAQWTLEKIRLSTLPNLLVSVPLHPAKEKKRGYNQLHLFADELSNKWHIPHHRDCLRRLGNNKAQARKDRKHREKSKNNFELNEPIRNQNVLLIDDVCTTGNTLASCAWPLVEQNNTVSVLIMAVD